MRLSRPILASPQIITCDPQDLPQHTYQTVLQNDPTAVSGCETSQVLGSGQFMLLPQSFGNIYLGETFTSYICVHNCSSSKVEGVIVNKRLKYNENGVKLSQNETPITLGVNESFDDVLHYEVKECGEH